MPVRFPALRLAREALTQGGSAPIVLNAANEIAVSGFLARRIGFLEIARTVERCLERTNHRAVAGLDDVYEIDGAAREVADRLLAGAAERTGRAANDGLGIGGAGGAPGQSRRRRRARRTSAR